jgi:hypothetical protein
MKLGRNEVPIALQWHPCFPERVFACQSGKCDAAAGLGLLVAKGQPNDDQLLFLEPFDWKLWIALLGTVFAAALIQKLLSLYTPYGDM